MNLGPVNVWQPGAMSRSRPPFDDRCSQIWQMDRPVDHDRDARQRECERSFQHRLQRAARTKGHENEHIGAGRPPGLKISKPVRQLGIVVKPPADVITQGHATATGLIAARFTPSGVLPKVQGTGIVWRRLDGVHACKRRHKRGSARCTTHTPGLRQEAAARAPRWPQID